MGDAMTPQEEGHALNLAHLIWLCVMARRPPVATEAEANEAVRAAPIARARILSRPSFTRWLALYRRREAS